MYLTRTRTRRAADRMVAPRYIQRVVSEWIQRWSDRFIEQLKEEYSAGGRNALDSELKASLQSSHGNLMWSFGFGRLAIR